MCDKEDGVDVTNVTNQKSGLKISILNLLKINGKYLIGFYLMNNEEQKSQRVQGFLQVTS